MTNPITAHRLIIVETAVRDALTGFMWATLEPYRSIGTRVLRQVPQLVRETDEETIAAIRADLGRILDEAGVYDENIAATEMLLPCLPCGAQGDWPLVEAVEDVMRSRGIVCRHRK